MGLNINLMSISTVIMLVHSKYFKTFVGKIILNDEVRNIGIEMSFGNMRLVHTRESISIVGIKERKIICISKGYRR